MPKVKDKERILKAERIKQLITYNGAPIRLSDNFSTETLQTKKDWYEILSDEKQRPTTKITLTSKAIMSNQWTDKELPRQG